MHLYLNWRWVCSKSEFKTRSHWYRIYSRKASLHLFAFVKAWEVLYYYKILRLYMYGSNHKINLYQERKICLNVSSNGLPRRHHHRYIEGVRKNLQLAKKVIISKKSTIFVLFSWNLVKLTTSRVTFFDQVSWG